MASKRFLEMFLDFLMMLNPESSLPNSIFEFLKIKSTEDQGSLMKHPREVSDNAQPSCIFCTPAFIFYEQFVQTLPSSVQTVGIAVAVMLSVTFGFMPKHVVLFIVTLILVSITTGIFGFVFHWDLIFSLMTVIRRVMIVFFLWISVFTYAMHFYWVYVIEIWWWKLLIKLVEW